MTMQNPTPTKIIELPQPGFPMLVLLVTDNLVPNQGDSKDATVSWLVSKPHPFVANMNVVRMFREEAGVEIYSASSDGKTVMRDLIPMNHVRLVQEAMPLDVFVDELSAAESGMPDDDDDDFDDATPNSVETESPTPPQTNGQTAS